MKHKQISIGLSRTYSLPNYGNVRPSVTFSVEMEEEDDPEAVIATLTGECNRYICREVDVQRERVGLPAIYDTLEPRVDIVGWRDVGVVFLVKSNTPHRYDDTPGSCHHLEIPLDSVNEYGVASRGQRYSYALKHATAYTKALGLDFFDWGELSWDEVLPEMWDVLVNYYDGYVVGTLHLSKRCGYMEFDKRHAFIAPASALREYLATETPHFDKLVFFRSQEAAKAYCDERPRLQYVWHLNTCASLTEAVEASIAERDTFAEEPQADPEPEAVPAGAPQ